MSFSDFMAHLQTLTNDPPAATAYAESYIAPHNGAFPIVEDDIAHFIYKKSSDVVVGIAGDWNGFDARKAVMTPVGGGLLHYQHRFEADARLDYILVEVDAASAQKWLSHSRASVHAHTLLDPLNPRVGASAFGAPSELAMPGYQRPLATKELPGILSGVLREGSMKSKILHHERHYMVYLPADYNPYGAPYPCVYFHDGGDYLNLTNASTILNNLIGAGRIPPLVAVFVPPQARDHEYNCNDHYVHFFCDDLVPELQSLYNLTADPGRRAVIGPSLGGLISLYMGKQRPDVFGLVGAQSSAVHTINGVKTFDARTAFAVEPAAPQRFYLVMGSYEDCFSTDWRGHCNDLLNPVRELHAVLERYGYSHYYNEYHQGHSWGLWRDSLDEALYFFFGMARA
jgi:enterochelin esterase-like enzyme